MRHNPQELRGLNVGAELIGLHERNEPWVLSVVMKTDHPTREVLKVVRHDPHEVDDSLMLAVRHYPHWRNEHLMSSIWYLLAVRHYPHVLHNFSVLLLVKSNVAC